ncbi:MAG: geranylgeranyl reductase family protein [Desulfomonilia bacterium]|jgi:geranylgeranyl reductase family protein
MEIYDVIIVGCGPAGATAGHILGKLGLHTLLIDKSIFPRRKLCGGGLTHKTLMLLQRVFNENEISLKKNEIINYKSYDYDIYFKDQLLVHGISHFPICFVDRYAYDYYLLEKARCAGVTVLEGEKIKSIDLNNNILSTLTGRNLKAQFIIGADGAHSIIRSKLPDKYYHKNNWEYNLSTALEIVIPRSEIQQNIDRPVIHFGYIDWGYSWIFPNKDAVIIGIGGLNRKNSKRFAQLFHEYISAVTLFYKIKNIQHIKIHGHPVPSGNYLKKPIYHNVMLVGDAAGFSDPISGEGIYQAQRSAEIAAMSIYKSLKTKASLDKTYINLLQRYVFPDLLHAKILRWFVFTAFNKLDINQIGIIMKYGEKRALDIIHGQRTYKFLRRINGLHEGII